MSEPVQNGDRSPGQHIELVGDSPPSADQPSPVLRDSKGWDGKLRVPKTALVTNPDAFSDPEYSDDENVFPGEHVAADEGGA